MMMTITKQKNHASQRTWYLVLGTWYQVAVHSARYTAESIHKMIHFLYVDTGSCVATCNARYQIPGSVNSLYTGRLFTAANNMLVLYCTHRVDHSRRRTRYCM